MEEGEAQAEQEENEEEEKADKLANKQEKKKINVQFFYHRDQQTKTLNNQINQSSNDVN